MTIARIYQTQPLSINTTISLDEKGSHHVARVLRATVGDLLSIFNGEGGEYTSTIIKIDKKHVYCELTAFDEKNNESPLNLYLAQGIARGEKMDFIVQKAVELGVKKIIPLITERCNVRLDAAREEKRLLHWQSVIISACEQSGRNLLPEILSPVFLTEWLPSVQFDHAYVLTPHTKEKKVEEKMKSDATVILLIGPEGGLTDSETKKAQEKGFNPLNFGPRVLRTETAAMGALSIFQYNHGDMR